jgi:hypothetical protein
MKELALGAATFTLALFAMQSVVSAQTTTPTTTTTVSPATTVSPTRTPSPTGQVQGDNVTVPGGAPSTGFGGK